MSRNSMVPFKNLVEIYSQSHHKNDLEAMNHLEYAFEQGMIETLKEIAYTELVKYEKIANEIFKNSKKDTELDSTFNRVFEVCNTENQRNAIMDLESALNHRASLDSEKHFIDGFISGYKFLKKINH